MSKTEVGLPESDLPEENQPLATESAEVAEVLEPLLEQLELPKEKEAQVRRMVTTILSFQGPIPPPMLLRQYEDVVPGSADRLIRLTEKQTDHRIDMERTIVKGRVGLSVRGQVMAFVLSVFFGVIALWLGLEGHDRLAGTIAVTTIIGLAVVFVLGKKPGESSTRGRQERDGSDPDQD